MKIKHSVILITLLLSMALSLVACDSKSITEDTTSDTNNGNNTPTLNNDDIISNSNDTNDVDKIPTVEELLTGIVATNNELTSWRYDSNIDMDMEIMSGQSSRYKMSILNSGAVDLSANKMQMNVDMSMDILGQSVETSMTTYIIDDIIYVKAKTPDSNEEKWTKQELDTDQLEEVRNMAIGLASNSNLIEWIETVSFDAVVEDEIDGATCYLLEANPDIADVLALTNELMQGIDATGELTPDGSNTFNNIRIKIWIAQGTYHILRSEICMMISIETNDSQVSGDMQINTTLRDHNKEIDIKLPPEAITT